jgi:hypothetical protein
MNLQLFYNTEIEYLQQFYAYIEVLLCISTYVKACNDSDNARTTPGGIPAVRAIQEALECFQSTWKCCSMPNNIIFYNYLRKLNDFYCSHLLKS